MNCSPVFGVLFLLISLTSAPVMPHASAQAPAVLPLPATDTLRLTLPQMEDYFKQRNLSLLANRLGIDENRAYQLQARLLNNPTVYIEQMPYNPQRKEFMPIRQSNSEQVVQVQQLLLLAGKRNKQLAISATNTQLATDRFDDLVRTLNYQLRSTFYNLYFGQQAVAVYDQEIATLQRTVDLYQTQFDKGNVPLKDLTRLKAYLFGLVTERQTRLNQITDDQTTLAVLLNSNVTVPIQPLVSAAELTNRPDPNRLSLDQLVTQAEQNRPDLRGYRDQTRLEGQNLALQKALAVPDLTVQGTFDRNAGYVPNYFGVGVGVKLPFFNKNQGNIQAAKIRTQSSQQLSNAYAQQVEGEIQRSLAKAKQADQLYRSFNHYNADFGRLIEGVTQNYRKQNIDVVEFLDFFDSYKNAQIQFNQLQNDRVQRLEDLNYAVGQIIS